MRSPVGKRVRAALFDRVPEVVPGFERLKNPAFSRELWVWQRRDGVLYQWIWYQQDRYEDRFTLELSWSLISTDPFTPQVAWPVTESFTPEGQRLRLGSLFTQGMDYWWHVSDPLPDMLAVSPEEFAQRLMKPPVYPEAETDRRIAAAVDAAALALEEHAEPYFARVRAWAQGEQPRQGV